MRVTGYVSENKIFLLTITIHFSLIFMTNYVFSIATRYKNVGKRLLEKACSVYGITLETFQTLIQVYKFTQHDPKIFNLPTPGTGPLVSGNRSEWNST